jgi:hypothetical protein
MIKAQIIIEMTDGQLYTYVNSHLADKAETDNNGNYIFKGEPGKYYMYTGEDGDEYDDQDSAGMAKADYEALLSDAAGTSGYLHFPDGYDELLIPRDKEINNEDAFTRVKLPRENVKSIKLVETHVVYPFGRPSADYIAKPPKMGELYSIPKEVKTTYDRYVSMPVVKENKVNNFNDFEFVYYRKPKTEQWIEIDNENFTVDFDCELVGEINGIKGGVSFYKA